MTRKKPSGLSRRDALKALGAAAGSATLTAGCADNAAGPSDTDSDSDAGVDLPLDNPLEAIDTIVVLMMENRTFDHYFGALSLEEGREDVDGLTADMFNPDADGEPVHPFHLDKECLEDPPHGWSTSRQQFNEGRNNGFVTTHQGGRTEASREVMGYHNRGDLPVYYALADAHANCDRWFASQMTGTWPNRFYSLCGTSDGMKGNEFSRVPFPRKSIFAQLDEAGIPWRVYCHDLPFASLLVDTAGEYDEEKGRITTIDRYFEDAAAGRLPPVVFIEPGYSFNDDHPPHPPLLGQALVGGVYRALAESDHWSRSLMVVTYDEHGGFFDHVVPPTAPDEHADEGFDQLGFRVPGLVLGPYASARVISTQYDHTSILKTIQERFGLEPLSLRNESAEPLWDCLDLDAMANLRPAPAADLPVLEVSPADYGGECSYFFLPNQIELEEAADQGLIPPELDFRDRSVELLDRVLAHAARLGVVRFTGKR